MLLFNLSDTNWGDVGKIIQSYLTRLIKLPFRELYTSQLYTSEMLEIAYEEKNHDLLKVHVT